MASERKGMVLLILRSKESAWQRLHEAPREMEYHHLITTDYGAYPSPRSTESIAKMIPGGSAPATLCDVPKASIAGQWAVKVVPQQRPTHMCHRDGLREKGNGPLDLEVERVSMASPSRGSQRDGIPPPNYDRLRSLSISQVYRVFRENDTKGVRHQLRSATCQRLPSQANGQYGRREKGNGPLDLEASRESAWHRLHEAPREMVYWVFRENDTKGVRHRLRSATCQRLPSQATKGRHRWHNISCTAHRAFVPHGRRIRRPGAPTSDRTPATLCDVPKASIAGQWAVRVVPQQRPTHMCHRDGRREKGNGPLDLEASRESAWHRLHEAPREMVYWVFRENDTKGVRHRLRSATCQRLPSQATKGRHRWHNISCTAHRAFVPHGRRIRRPGAPTSDRTPATLCDVPKASVAGQWAVRVVPQQRPTHMCHRDGRREKGNGPLDLEASRESAWHRLHEAPREMVYWVFRENDTKGVRHRLRSATCQRLPSQATKGRHRWHNISCTAHRAFVPHGRRIRRPGAPTSDRTPATLCDVPKGFRRRPMGSEGGPSTASHAYVSQRWPPGEKEWSS
ncbi:hypothetical protein F5148DRAFT_1151551 [Russula earlei]|uniref:Uncharacterized protein n=1 Tax=Russula earlei TaxID=71964 RepID=A0ACC0TZT6_9AGAM|nr:hypothetical protein F5148DRAFT_1151551 [Russula earlei]